MEERFVSKIDKESSADGCWLWCGTLGRFGYGQFHLNGKQHRAHRVSWLLSGNIIPEGHLIRHKCRSRKCVNPAHLETGTYQENQLDRIRDGTDNRGAKCYKARLTESQVLEIRMRMNERICDLAKEYSVSTGTINDITSRRTWKHI